MTTARAPCRLCGTGPWVPGCWGEKRGGSRSGGRSPGRPHGSGASAARFTGVPSAVAAGLGPGGHSVRPRPCWGLLRGGADAPVQDFKFCDVLGVAAGAEVAPFLSGGLALARLTRTGSRTGRQPAISRGGAGGPGDHAAPGSCPGEGWPGPPRLTGVAARLPLSLPADLDGLRVDLTGRRPQLAPEAPLYSHFPRWL